MNTDSNMHFIRDDQWSEAVSLLEEKTLKNAVGTFVNTLSCKSKGLTFFAMTILLWIFGRLFLLARGKKKKKKL